MAKVTGHGVQRDAAGQVLVDGNGNEVHTGFLTIELLDRPGTRENVPYVLPAVGNSLFMGALPEVGALCIVGFRQQQQPVIVGFLPPSISGLVRGRQTVPNLEPGEVLMQSGTHGTDSAGNENVFRGARVHLDRYGRIKIEAQDYECTIGYMLSNEYSQNVQYAIDPVTNNPVYFRERTLGVERRVDKEGNSFRAVGGDDLKQVVGNQTHTIGGALAVTARLGMVFQDARGNQFGMQEDGTMLVTAKQDMTVSVSGDSAEEVSAAKSTVVANDYQVACGGAYQAVGQSFKTTSATDVVTNATTGIVSRAVAGSVISTVTPGLGKVRMGYPVLSPLGVIGVVAGEPAVMGDRLALLLNALAKVLSLPSLGILNPATGDVAPSPVFVAALQLVINDATLTAIKSTSVEVGQ